MRQTDIQSDYHREKALENLLRLDEEELLKRYRQTGDPDAKWALALQNADMVRVIANQARGVYADFAQTEDIIHDGILVLLDSVDKFDPLKGAKFRTYVAKRVRGMVIDLARRQHWSSRRVRQLAAQINRVEDRLIGELGRKPSDQEMAECLGFSVEKFESVVAEIALSNVVSFEVLLNAHGEAVAWGKGEENESMQPEAAYQEKELYDTLRKGIEGLRERERMVLSLYYEQELNMKEIAQILGISAPRVSQIHSRAIEKMRNHMEAYLLGDSQQQEWEEKNGKGILQSDIRHALSKSSAGCGGQ